MDYAKLGAELYQIVRIAFLQSVAGNLLGTIQGEIEAGTATYGQALNFASDSGRILAALLREQMAPGVLPDDIMHAEIAENMITPLMTDQYALVSEVCMQVQQNLNDRYGVSLAPQRPEFRQERADGIARSVSGRPVEEIGPSFDNAVENYSMSVVDDSVRTNAEFQYEAGFEPQIVRTADAGACEWCQDRAGTYEYARVRRTGSEVFRRHANCRCAVEYVPGNGRRQNVHDKTWRRETEEERNSRVNTAIIAQSSGGVHGALNDINDPDQSRRDAHAERYYNEIRNRDRNYEIAAVARNSGFSEEDIDVVFAHVFENDHLFEDGSIHRFDPDYNMAESWRRLREGKNIQDHDMILLYHEREEAVIMNSNPNITYENAHNIVVSIYNYPEALMAFLERNG